MYSSYPLIFAAFVFGLLFAGSVSFLQSRENIANDVLPALQVASPLVPTTTPAMIPTMTSAITEKPPKAPIAIHVPEPKPTTTPIVLPPPIIPAPTPIPTPPPATPATTTPPVPAPDPLLLCRSLPRATLPKDTGITKGPIISFNFDDGFASAYEHGLPIFNAAGMRTTEYIITGFLDKPGRVTLANVKTMALMGHEIGAHTRTHPYLTKVSGAQAIQEICGSRKDLIDRGITPDTFAYPEGDMNADIEAIVREAGFSGARVTKPGLNSSASDIFALRYLGVDVVQSWPKVKQAIDEAIQKQGWLILVFHRVDEDGNPISVRHEEIQQIVDYVKAKKIPVVTNAEGLRIVSNIPQK